GRRQAYGGGQAARVEDEGDRAVAHDGGAGEDRGVLQQLAERFDDDLGRVGNLVDDQAELTVLGVEHHDVDHLPAHHLARAGRATGQQLIEEDEGQQVAAQAVDGGVVDALDPAAGQVAFQTDQLDEVDLGDRIVLDAF